MKKHTGKIQELIREKSSRNGNPKFTAVIVDAAGFTEVVTTATDSSLGYGISNYSGKWIEYTRKASRGRFIFESVKTAEPTSDGRYIESEFNSLPDSPAYKLQIVGTSSDGETGRTKWLQVPAHKLHLIREILSH